MSYCGVVNILLTTSHKIRSKRRKQIAEMRRLRVALFCSLVLVAVSLSLSGGYVLDHNRERGLRGQQGPTTPRNPRAPVKTNEEEEETNSKREGERHRDEHSTNQFMTESTENETNQGSSHWSQIFDRLLPSRYHGHMQLGPGLSVNFSTGFNSNAGSIRHWWRGPNVCTNTVEKEEGDVDDSRDGRRIFHHKLMITYSCDDTVSARTCTTVKSSNGKTTTTTQTFECCPGFAREEDQQYCTEETEKVDLISTMEQLGSTEMVRALALSGLTNVVQSGIYTVFAPSNQAFDRYHRPEADRNVVVINEDVERLSEGLNQAMTSHVVPGSVKTSSVEDEQLIETENPDARIRINKYIVPGRSVQLVTANCVPLSRTNVKATNGIVHLLDSVLQPVTQDIKSILRADPRLSVMSSVLEKIDLEENGQYTILAPTDEAFQKLSPDVRDKILHGHTCGKDVMKQHILPNVICSTVIEGRVRTRNVLNNYVHMSRDEDRNVLIETSRVLQSDVMATNGVIQIIDEIILPSAALDVMKAIEKVGATKFMELLRATNLDRELQEMGNYTLFVPSNQALEESGKMSAEVSRDQDDVSKMLAGHVVSGIVRGRQLYHGRQLNSSQSAIYTVQSYQAYPMGRQSVKSVQCSPIVRADIETCDAVIHVVHKLIIPPSGDVLNLVQKNATFSDLFALIRTAQLTEFFSNNHRPFTLFAPTNQAFRTLPSGFLDEIRNDSTKARKVILSHMLPDIRCCSAVFDIFTTHELNMDGWMISLDKQQPSNRVHYGSIPVVSCDQTASNGVVHAIDSFSPAVIRRYTSRGNRRGSSSTRFSLDDFWSMFD